MICDDRGGTSNNIHHSGTSVRDRIRSFRRETRQNIEQDGKIRQLIGGQSESLTFNVKQNRRYCEKGK